MNFLLSGDNEAPPSSLNTNGFGISNDLSILKSDIEIAVTYDIHKNKN